MGALNIALVAASGLVLAAVVASRLSSRLGIPALLLFLLLGMLAGSDGPGGIDFEDYDLSRALGIVALAFILFSGGLNTRWTDVRPVLARAVALATVGVLITAMVAGFVAAWALDLPLTTGLLVGAIVSSTDAAAVFAVLRTRSVSLRPPLRPLLELESGSNDPMAVFLTIGFLELVLGEADSAFALVPMFLAQMTIGAVVGLGAGRFVVWVVNHLRLDAEGLYPVLTLGLVAFTYGVTAMLGGSGFLAVYLAGIVMARHRFIHRNSLTRFHDAVGWLSQIGMFLVLGLLVFPSQLPAVALEALVLAGALIVVARPSAVFLTLAPFRVAWRQRALVSWVGLRGATPIILATFPLMERAPDATVIFDTVFFVVLTSVLLQGTTIAPAARLLGVAQAEAARPAWPLELAAVPPEGAELHEVLVGPGSMAAGKAVIDLGLPPGTILVLVRRVGDDGVTGFAVPTGSTVLQAGDDVLVLGPDSGIDFVRELTASVP